MRQDLSDFVDVARARHPGVPVFVLGESMGGAVVLSALASPAPPQAAGFILVAPAVWGWRALPFSYRATLWMAAHVLPGKSFTGGGLKIVPSDNIEMLRANGRDPLFIKNTRTDAIYGLVNLMGDALEASSHVERGPVLFVYGGRDQIIPKSATEAAIAGLGGRAEIKRYDEGYHMLLRDLHAEPRWADVADWIRAHEIGPLAAMY
jgi:alpha-beta hydrolase superfamily lysophospholipase